MNQLVSVIIPVWKPKLNQLEQSINSIISQTYSNLEILIIYRPDKSFDEKFKKIISEYKDERIIIKISDKIGPSNAMNVGINIAKGEFIARMDADDISAKNRIERQVKIITQKKIDVVGTWGNLINIDNKKIKKLIFPINHSEIRKKIILFDPIIHSSVLMKKEIFKKNKFYDEKLISAEDYELWCRLISEGYRFYNIPEYLINLRVEPDSITRGKFWKEHRRNVKKVRVKAIRKYGFAKPQDIYYYVFATMLSLISPKWERIGRKILKNEHY